MRAARAATHCASGTTGVGSSTGGRWPSRGGCPGGAGGCRGGARARRRRWGRAGAASSGRFRAGGAAVAVGLAAPRRSGGGGAGRAVGRPPRADGGRDRRAHARDDGARRAGAHLASAEAAAGECQSSGVRAGAAGRAAAWVLPPIVAPGLYQHGMFTPPRACGRSPSPSSSRATGAPRDGRRPSSGSTAVSAALESGAAVGARRRSPGGPRGRAAGSPPRRWR